MHSSTRLGRAGSLQSSAFSLVRVNRSKSFSLPYMMTVSIRFRDTSFCAPCSSISSTTCVLCVSAHLDSHDIDSRVREDGVLQTLTLAHQLAMPLQRLQARR